MVCVHKSHHSKLSWGQSIAEINILVMVMGGRLTWFFLNDGHGHGGEVNLPVDPVSRPSLNASPRQVLDLWKACVLPHLLQNLRYLQESQVERLQVTLNRSLARSLHVYGETTALCADMGVPPLRLTQQVTAAGTAGAAGIQMDSRLQRFYPWRNV